MKRLLIFTAATILAIPVSGLLPRPAYGQDGGFGGDTVDLTNLLNGGGNNNGNRGNNNRQPQIPDSQLMFKEIQDTLKKGKTPLEKAQEKPVQSLISTEIVALTDKIQLLRNNNGNNNNNNLPNNNNANNRGGQPNQGGNNNQNNNQPSAQALQIETITTLKNEDFLNTKLSGFLTPEQIALVQKTHAEDKKNETCLGGMLDRAYNAMQNQGRGNNNQNNQNNNQNFNNNQNNQNNNQTRPGTTLKYCMTQSSTPSERLEPIRKVLAKGNMPLAADKNTFAEVFMKAQLQDLEAALRSGLTNNNNNQGGRGGNNNNNRNNDPRQIIQSGVDGIYKKLEAQLKPEQADVLKMWHYTQMLERTPIDALIAVNAMQDTPLSDEQIAKVTAAWPEYQRQIEDAARAAKKQITQKQRESAAMQKILDTFLEPSQIVSYQLAKKYGPEAAAGGK